MSVERTEIDGSLGTDSYRTRVSDRFVPKAVSADMVIINGARYSFSPTKQAGGDDGSNKARRSLYKTVVRSPQKILTFDATDSASSEATARREALSARDIAADVSAAEADVLRSLSTGNDGDVSFSCSRKALSEFSESGHKRRTIPRKPFQELRVPGMPDDFYMSPLDWSASNQVVVSLPSGIHIWDANTTMCYNLTDKTEAERHPVRCLAWRNGLHREQLAEGLDSGVLRIRDVEKETIVDQWDAHCFRIGTCAWCPKGAFIATGSKDHTVGIIDPREHTRKPTHCGHSQEVCGVKWDNEGMLLASGGNDNLLILWDHRMMDTPLHIFEGAHRAAVKALAWSPHRRGRLVSGGGTADRRLRFWDVTKLSCMGEVDSGSQVCNVAWSANIDEIVSTHGFSQNHIVVWDTSASTSSPVPVSRPAVPVATLRGHTSRVLHLAVSPDGRTIATCAADNTLRFWSVFPSKNAPLMLYSAPTKCDKDKEKRTSNTKAVKQQCSDGQSLMSSSDQTAMMADCSMNFR